MSACLKKLRMLNTTCLAAISSSFPFFATVFRRSSTYSDSTTEKKIPL
jgi:hypothetical protein